MIYFENRLDAGAKLADKIEGALPRHCPELIVLGIPRGGIEVGYPIAEKLGCPLEPITVRKLPIPGNDQMGFGAVTMDKEIVLNRELIAAGYVHPGDIDPIIEEVYREVLRRDKVYRRGRPPSRLENRCVIIADDGLATGFTMLAAVRYGRRKGAATIVAAVPVAHQGSYQLVSKEVDQVLCLQVDGKPSFAVASFYASFPDLSDREVILMLDKAGEHTE